MELEIHRAEGSRMWDHEGRSYLDFISGISVSIVGHRHPRVHAAVLEQLDKYWHTMVYGEHVLQPQVHLAKLLHEVLGPPFEQVYLVNSGAEAIEGAMKLVKKVSGRSRLVSFAKAYHGGTHGALSLLGSEHYKAPFRPLLPETYMLAYNAVEDLDFLDERVAAVFVEAVQAEAGAVPADKEWAQALASRCKSLGIALVVDEIQTGLGRCGDWFGFQHLGWEPEVVVLAKGLGGGLPIGAFAASRAWMQHLAVDPPLGHLTTFGGNPVCAAAAVGVLEVLRDEGLIAKAAACERIVRDRISTWDHGRHGAAPLSGRGLLLGLETGSAARNQRLIQRCWKAGLLVDWFLFDDAKMRIAPPLNITEDDLHQALDLLEREWQEVPGLAT